MSADEVFSITAMLANMPTPNEEHYKEFRQRKKTQKIEDIAILDMETDPFDNVSKDKIYPFLAVLYAENFEPIVIWDNEFEAFVDKVVSAIEALPRSYTIYAHNGGKFDFMFLMHKLRGRVNFKGRGIMSAQIGEHQLRDSFHIIPERLANFKKDKFDYVKKLKKASREMYRDEIIKYCINDCKYLLDIVKSFVKEYGFKISIGQAAMANLKSHYKFDNVSENTDEYLRQFFFGGRVECIKGRGHYVGAYNLYDVNSMYPFAMAEYAHPIGSNYICRTGTPDSDTIFLDISCVSNGAFVLRSTENGTHAPYGERHRFKTTIWEYNVAKKYNLIRDEEIHGCVDNLKRTNFKNFVNPLYDKRQLTKERLKSMKAIGLEGTPEFDDIKKDDIFLKLILNNAYGKFAQNPRRYKEHFVTDPSEEPPSDKNGNWGIAPEFAGEHYWIWSRPNPRYKFNNVGTGASITGAARAILLEAIQNADDPIYCDTDSLICRQLLNSELSETRLGAWDLEKELSEVIINGKKLYEMIDRHSGKGSIKAKGAGNITHDQMLELLQGGEITDVSKGTTLTKTGQQYYMTRRIRATAKLAVNA